ncbi:MAG: TetR/AcrR family transcriptional regulator [Candidatus Eisenbacteria bacterium]|uniref:TetR/AcrR family transcriptional regulator n=1 Tax=Eiseniibacteriota bacterium TaxID=2212470 RepID=A0A956NHR8_UNCEI|nr:TetR/AcrR family transcriptional regulator [Candidatus Eisenbacteria bacterium]MCB9464957.1 TetR/AcrR family transcriptional regulator [Candidatus Eisenbacteria bacterium]
MAELEPTPDPAGVRARILQNAMSLFARYGFAGTSVRQIAEVSGLTKAGLYYHFPDKASLYRAAIVETSRYLESRVSRATEESPEPARRVRAYLHAHVRTFVEEGHLLRLFYNNLFLGAEDAPSLGSEMEAHECVLIRLLGECADAGLLSPDHVEPLSLMLTGGLEVVGATWLIDPGHPPPSFELADQLLVVAAPRIAEAAGIDPSTTYPKKGNCS